MNATMGHIKEDVSFVEVLVFPMLTIVKNALFRRKIEMAVPKLSTWVALKLTCSMKGKNMDSKEDRIMVVISFVHTWCLINFLCGSNYSIQLIHLAEWLCPTFIHLSHRLKYNFSVLWASLNPTKMELTNINQIA